MKRRTLVALVVTAVVIGGLLLLFPAEWVGLLIALVALLTAQAVLILRHTRVFPHPPGSGLRPVFSASHSSAQNIPQDVAPRTQPAPTAAPEEAHAPAPSEAAPVTADVFSRFRAHLETMEQGGAPSPAAANSARPARTAAGGLSPGGSGAAGPGAATDEVADQVQLSSGARRPNGGAAPKAQAQASATPQTQSGPSKAVQSQPAQPAVTGAVKPPAAPKAPPKAAPPKAPIPKLQPRKLAADEDEGPDLFADLRPALAVDRAGAREPARTDKPAPAASLADRAAQDEVGQALALAREPQQLREEAEALLRIAQEALDEDDLPRAKAVLDQHARLIADAPDLASLAAARVELRLAAREGRAEAAMPAYQAMLDRGYAPAEADLEPELDALLEGLPAESRAAAKAAALAKALAPFRQAGDRAAMDRLYERIEAAQEAAGDPRKLIQFYKNHLSIKEALGDTAGRLSLIDKIGNRYFQLGESAPAREFYEMGMKLRLEQDARQAASEQQSTVPAAAAPGSKREGGS